MPMKPPPIDWPYYDDLELLKMAKKESKKESKKEKFWGQVCNVIQSIFVHWGN